MSYDDAAADRDWTALCKATKEQLFQKALDALTNAPETLLPKPYDVRSKRAESAADIYSDWLTEKTERYSTLIKVLGLVDQGKGNSAECRLLAQAQITSCARDYAEFWCEPVAEQKLAQMAADAWEPVQ